LPSDIKAIMDGSVKTKGVIYISFGSFLKSKEMPVSTRETLAAVFRRLHDYTIIFKWEADGDDDKMAEDVPANVHLKSWMPQQDILANKQLRLFITQGGKNSFQEALCHHKPLVASFKQILYSICLRSF
jgi:glucuronosyltransferase